MKRRVLSTILIMIMAVNLMTLRASADDFDSEEASGEIYRVVVPTSYSFVVDPSGILDPGSMIASPEYSIINKSSTAIQVDMSFRLSAPEGVALDIKSNRNMVGSNPSNNAAKEIWLAAVFSENNELITQGRVMTSFSGAIVYRYKNLGNRETIQKEEAPAVDRELSGTAPIQNIPVEVVSGGAISMAPAQVISEGAISQEAVEIVSGGAITMAPNQVISEGAISQEAVEIVSGGAISMAPDQVIGEEAISQGAGEIVSGGAISMAPVQVASGGAISQAPTKVVSGGAISVDPKGLKPKSMESTIHISVQPVTGSAIIYSTESMMGDIPGEPVFYQDTVRAKGSYGNLAAIDEHFSNVLVINNDWSTKSIILDRARVYQLEDGTILTGEAAPNSGSVVNFRFLGTVNSRVKWSETRLKADIKFTFNKIDDYPTEQEGVEPDQKLDSMSADAFKLPEDNVKTEFNNEPSFEDELSSEEEPTSFDQSNTGTSQRPDINQLE